MAGGSRVRVERENERGRKRREKKRREWGGQKKKKNAAKLHLVNSE